jgi:radical SAM protein with 4Fe4S-binding SPASM domain
MWQNETVVHATEESEESIVGSVTRRFPGVDIALIAAYFLSGPVLLAAAHLWGVEFLNYGALGWRAVLIYGVGAPFVGYLLLSRSPRARFAAYVFLTLDIFRSLSAAHFLPVALDGAVLLYLQTGSMRRAYPPLRGAEMHARMRARVGRVGAALGFFRRKVAVATLAAATSADRGAGDPGTSFRPSLVSWNLTSACNLRCAHCYLDAGHRREGELTTDECCHVIDQMAALGTEMVILTGGEPLLRKDIFSIARYASQKGILVVMGTNGVMIDAEVASALKDSGLQGVGISLDSLHAERHDSFRGVQGCWEGAVRGIDACTKQGLQVIVQTTATQWNYEEIPALIDFAQMKGAAAFNLYYLVCTGRGEGLADITPQQYEESLAYVVEAQAHHPGIMVRAKCAPHANRIAHQRGSALMVSAGCPAGTSYIRITPEGQVTPCPYLPLVAGSLREAGLREIWEGSDLLLGLREPRLEGRCGGCEYTRVCIGCRARAWAIGGTLMGEDPWCSYQPGGGSPLPVDEVAWTPEAESRLQRIPSFIRGRVKLAIEAQARGKGHTLVTPEIMDEVRRAMGGHRPGKPTPP